MRPDTLWAGFLRSPYPHARILSIDTSRAQKLHGVKVVITGKDVSPRLEGVSLLDKPVLAQDRVRYIGEKVAAVAATDRRRGVLLEWPGFKLFISPEDPQGLCHAVVERRRGKTDGGPP